MGVGMLVRQGKYAVERDPLHNVSVGLDRHSKSLKQGGILTSDDVVRIEGIGSILFLREVGSEHIINIGFHGFAVGATIFSSERGIVEVVDKIEQVKGLLLFVYAGPEQFVKNLDECINLEIEDIF